MVHPSRRKKTMETAKLLGMCVRSKGRHENGQRALFCVYLDSTCPLVDSFARVSATDATARRDKTTEAKTISSCQRGLVKRTKRSGRCRKKRRFSKANDQPTTTFSMLRYGCTTGPNGNLVESRHSQCRSFGTRCFMIDVKSAHTSLLHAPVTVTS